MPPQPLPEDAAGRELRRTLAPGEEILAFATGIGGALLVATDWRALIIKASPAATGTWLGKHNTSFRYGQISRVDLYAATLGVGLDRSYGLGYVVITSSGEEHPALGRSRDAEYLIKAKNVCPFDPLNEAYFRQVVEIIRGRLYAPPL